MTTSEIFMEMVCCRARLIYAMAVNGSTYLREQEYQLNLRRMLIKAGLMADYVTIDGETWELRDAAEFLLCEDSSHGEKDEEPAVVEIIPRTDREESGFAALCARCINRRAGEKIFLTD